MIFRSSRFDGEERVFSHLKISSRDPENSSEPKGNDLSFVGKQKFL